MQEDKHASTTRYASLYSFGHPGLGGAAPNPSVWSEEHYRHFFQPLMCSAANSPPIPQPQILTALSKETVSSTTGKNTAKEDTLALCPPKRSMVGNRLEVTLVALPVEEAAAEGIDTGEKAVEDEERRGSSSACLRVETAAAAAAAAHAHQMVAFYLQAEASEET
ncbi:hypothetical protein BDR05DRAFT_952321 [Suillus weaverae]|nr:hypothetical protein BDR05DRAFT_952321 [Suillus weaverae]